jgi:outer membrane protein assembly factor BamA
MRRILCILIILNSGLIAVAEPVYQLGSLRADSLALTPPWQEGQIFARHEIFIHQSKEWLEAMDQRGYPFAQVWTRPLENSACGDTLNFEANCLSGPSGPLGELRVLGGDRLSEDFLSRMLRPSRRQAFSLKTAREGRARLAATGWFAEMAEPQLGWDPVESRVGVVYRVRERPRPNRVGILFGGGSGKRFGSMDLFIFSPFGGGRNWSIVADWQSGARSDMSLDFREPRVLGQSLDLGLRFHRSLQDSTWLRQSLDIEAEMPLPAGWRGRVVWGFERTLFGLEDREISRRRQGLGLRWRGLIPGRSGERRLRLDTDLLLREDGDLDEEQWEVSGDLLWTQSLHGNLKARLRAGGTWLRALEPLSEAELYSLGGAGTLRGWDEEHFRGDVVGSATLELAFGQGLELAAFVDYGQGRRDTGDEIIRFEGWGYGLGLRAPGERGSMILDLALGEGSNISDLRVHLKLETGF